MKKRIIALALALCMFGSSLFVGPSNEVTYAYQAEKVFNELRKVDTQSKADASSENNLLSKDTANSADNIVSFEDKKPSEEAQTNGVKPGEEAAEMATKTEVEANKDDSTKVGVTVEKVETNTDLTAGALENTLLNEKTVKDSDMVDVIIVFDENAVIDDDPNAEMNFFTKIKIAFMELSQNFTIWKIESKALDGKSLDIDYQYTWLLNGIDTKVPYGLIDEIEAINGVKDVVLQPVYEVSDVDEVNPHTIADGGMIGRDDTWASGYTGKGMKIAIIDTGIDEDHQNFQAMTSDKLTSSSADKDTVSAVIGDLNASALVGNLTADDVYLSNKIVYAFNYADGNLKINHDADNQGDHGTHVAGIAAANDLKNGEAVGVAPDAQLYVMKVFGESHSGAAAGDLLAAVEDAMILGADVINMSVGSAAGFTSDGEVFDSIYGKIAEAGVILAISAGNSETSAYGNMWGTNQNLTSNPDNATISSPGTYVNATTVASVENAAFKFTYLEIGGKKLAYYAATVQSGTITNAPVSTIAGNEYEVVFVPNAGQTAEDFASVDCEGKVVLVQRGVTAFTEKCRLAQEAGAIACIVFNNEPGLFGMNMDGGTATIPCVSISLESGEQILAIMDENPEAKIMLSDEEALVPSDDAYKMSTFSSWGVSPDLKLEPDLTAPGGNIYSTLDDGKYGLMSGTSMSSPNVAGLAALVKQYVKTNYPELTNTEVHKFVNALLMSTATVLETDGVAYSPRLQGAGLANAYLGINTKAYLTVDGMDMPKVELYDDPEKTGDYSYSFNVVNFGNSTIYYRLDTTIQTEGVDSYAISETDSIDFMNSTPVELDGTTTETSNNMVLTFDYNADKKANVVDAYELYANVVGEETGSDFFRYNLDNDEDVDTADVQAYLNALVGKTDAVALDDKVLEVKAGETAKVDVTVVVGEEGKDYMDTYYDNGIYVEGFTTLTAESTGDVDLSLPYMGFYGDWTQAPIFDIGYFWETAEETNANQYVHILWTQYAGELSMWYPGLNPYFTFDEEYDINNIALSPNGDGYADYLDDIYVSLLRNAAELSFTYTTEDGEVLFEEVVENAKKTIWMDGYGQIVPYIYTWYSYPYDLTDANGNPLADGTKLTLTISAKLDYDLHESNNLYDTWEIPITIDVSAPEILDAYIEQYEDEATGTTRYFLNMKFADNHATAAVNFLTKSGTVVLAQYPVDHSKPEGTEYVTYEVTGYGDEFMVVLGDYAFNEEAYYIEAEGNDPELDKTLLYGYRISDQNIGDDTLYGWLGIDKDSAASIVLDSEYYMDYSMVAAEYVGGYIVGVDANKDLVSIKPGYWDERTVIAHLGSEVRDMAFDPTTETLYAIYKENYNLVSIDIVTGEITEIGSPYSLSSAITLCCDDEGQLYSIDQYGRLKMIDKTTGKAVNTVLLDTKAVTGMQPYYSQSMTYDSAEDCIYWACFYDATQGRYGLLVKIDVNAETPSMEIIGQIAGNAEVVGLLALENKGFELPTDEKLQGIEVEQEAVALLVGNSENLGLVLDPWYGVRGETTWTSADEDVAVVSERGKVTATGVGETTITVSVVVDENTTLTAETTIKVVNPQATVNGFVMGSIGESLYNQWVTFDAEDMSYTANTEFSFTPYTAGEYVDGKIYAFGQDTSFSIIDAETYEVTKVGKARADYQITDMAYDYSTGYMYAIAQDYNYGMVMLAHIDMATGEIYPLAPLEEEYGDIMCALAVSTDGVIYALSGTGFLYEVEYVEEYECCELITLGYVGTSTISSYTQSMAYDHNAEEPGLYWSSISDAFAIMYIDIETVTALNLGTLDAGEQVSAMYIIPEEVQELDYVPVTDVYVNADSVAVVKGATVVPPVSILPLNATNREITWTVANTNIAVVENGLIKGVNKGSTTATGSIEIEVDGVASTYEFEITIDVVDAAGDLRGYLLTDFSTGDSGFWISVNDADLSTGTAITDYVEYLLYAGAYYDGYLYGYGMDMETYDSVFVIAKEVEGASIENGEELYETVKVIPGEYADVVDMAFDYTEGVMYAVAGTRNVMGPNALYCVDITTGELYKVNDMEDQVMTLACTADGQLYGVGIEGAFYAIDKYTGELEFIAQTDYIANQYQSMTYDYNSGNMYWAQVMSAGWSASANLFIINPEDGSLMDLGHIGMLGAEVSALHTIPKENITVGTASVVRIALNSSSEVLQVGDTVNLSAVALPIAVKGADIDYVFESDNTEVATVDSNGVVTAVASGVAHITVTANGKEATCTVNVLGNDTKIQAVSNNGWQISPLLSPNTIENTVTLPNGCALDMAMVTYVDGWYYALDTANAFEGDEADYQTVAYSRGDLWRFNEDLSVVEKVSDTSVYTTFEDCDGDYLVADAVLDIFANPFTGDVYVLGRSVEDNWWNYYAIYELNVETGETTWVGYVPEDLKSPQKIEFISEDTMVVWDHYDDYVYTMSFADFDPDALFFPVKQLVWAQGIMAAGYNLGMVYNKELDAVFVASVNAREDGSKQIGLYILDPYKKTIKKIADTAYDEDMIDLVFVQ